MKEIISTTYEVSFDGEDWMYIEDGWQYAEPSETTVTKYSDFKELYDLLATKSIEGICQDDTLYRKRPQISISSYCHAIYLTEKTFKPFFYRVRKKVYTPCVNWLLNNLSLEQLSNYAKDRGISISLK